ncbi:MAG: hypothetical protein QOC55_2072 [Thermoleophilaceae bacterium]|nr:hypothetical protein [Thermoleophilaceae bacterium]
MVVGWRLWVAAALASAALATCSAGPAFADPVEACPPADPPPAVDDTYAPPPDLKVACVESVRAIDGQTLLHWYAIARLDLGAPDRSARAMDEAMTFLLDGLQTEGEAQDRHIFVSALAVRRRFNAERHASFNSRADFERFLSETGETVADVKYRVKVEMLAARIVAQVVKGHRTPAARQRAFDRFLIRFGTKWQARTWCRDDYKVDLCGSPATAP